LAWPESVRYPAAAMLAASSVGIASVLSVELQLLPDPSPFKTHLRGPARFAVAGFLMRV
jgi:hypothetical protein